MILIINNFNKIRNNKIVCSKWMVIVRIKMINNRILLQMTKKAMFNCNSNNNIHNNN